MKYNIYTLGCKVNEYESEYMESLLENHGYTKSQIPDIVIINTCTVTNNADSKSRKMIRRARKQFKDALLIVCGCMVQNKKDKDIDADIIIGNEGKSEIINYIKDYNNKKIYDVKDIFKSKFENMNLTDFDRVRAYIKIQDGCDNYCSFCIIPYVRGHLRSKKKEDVLKEARDIVNSGHREIVLTGIHTGNYHDEEYEFADLLKDLTKIQGLKRLRISSIEITEINEKVLEVIKNKKILTDHMHIPLQSGSDNILKLMNRKYDTKLFEKIIKKIRDIRPNISITTDVITGFPGETEEFFEQTLNFIKKIKFTKLHVFPYSDRKGTKASTMDGKIDGKVKKERVKKLIDLSKKLELEYMEKHIKTKTSFIPETYEEGYLIGHTGNYLQIKAKGSKDLIGKEILIEIENIDYPYMISKVIDNDKNV